MEGLCPLAALLHPTCSGWPSLGCEVTQLTNRKHAVTAKTCNSSRPRPRANLTSVGFGAGSEMTVIVWLCGARSCMEGEIKCGLGLRKLVVSRHLCPERKPAPPPFHPPTPPPQSPKSLGVSQISSVTSFPLTGCLQTRSMVPASKLH